MKSMRLSFISGVMIIVSSFVFAAGKPAVAIEVASINEFTTELMSIAGKLSPQTPAAMLPALMGMPIKNPNLAGIDRTKPFQIQIFLPEATGGAAPESPIFAILLPVLDNGKAYLDLLSQSVSQPIEKNGAKIFRSSSTDALYIKVAGDYALICDKEEGLNAVGDNIKISQDSLLDVKGTFRIGVIPQSLISYLEKAREMTTSAMSNASATSSPVEPQKIVDTELSAIISAVKQIEGAALGIKFTDKYIDLNSRLNPVAGSKIAEISKTLKVPAAKYKTIAPKNALYAGYGTGMDSVDFLIEPYSEIMREMYSAMGPQMEGLGDELANIMKSYKGMYAGNYAMGVIPVNNNKLGFYEVLELNDAKKAESLMLQQYALSGKKFAESSNIEINIATNSRVYKNISITSVSYKPCATSTNMEVPPVSPLLLSKLNGEVAYINNDMVYALGGQDVMNTVIDRMLSTSTESDSAQFTELLPAAGGKVVQAYIMHPAEIIKSALSLIPGVDSTMFAGMSQKTGGVAGYIVTNGKDITGIDRISIDEIIAIKHLIPIMRSLAMGAASQMQMTPPTPAPVPQSR